MSFWSAFWWACAKFLTPRGTADDPPSKKRPQKMTPFFDHFFDMFGSHPTPFQEEAISYFRLIAFCLTLRTCWIEDLRSKKWCVLLFISFIFLVIFILCWFSSYVMISRKISVESMSMALTWTGVGWLGKCTKWAKSWKNAKISKNWSLKPL